MNATMKPQKKNELPPAAVMRPEYSPIASGGAVSPKLMATQLKVPNRVVSKCGFVSVSASSPSPTE